ncbi:hypothetical protein NE237_030179 [Protea cynaroides]|uniref:Uncharacterized protein n=1 Tax=Protea cynaroides TaxID=273540 RepID=A0A9Q0GSJ3_9MAGN|nr:hypothetical protein NE237_030179 [Protea cynaroides]
MKDDYYIHMFVKIPARRFPIIKRGMDHLLLEIRVGIFNFLTCAYIWLRSLDFGFVNDVLKVTMLVGLLFGSFCFSSSLAKDIGVKKVTSKKAALIDTFNQLRDKIGPTAFISREKGEVISDHYKLFPVDLRDIQKLDVITLAQLDPRCYSSSTIFCPIHFAVSRLPIFGDTRIERLELFEEWNMMQEHYCVAYAINDAMGLFEGFGFPTDDQRLAYYLSFGTDTCFGYTSSLLADWQNWNGTHSP